MTLLLQAQLPPDFGGLDAEPLYISTEGDLPMKRLRQMEFSLKKNLPAELQKKDFSSGIFVENCLEVEQLWQIITSKLPIFFNKNKKLRLVVIDSIAALFRADFAFEEAHEKSKVLWKIASQLKFLADVHNAIIVVTNQVSDNLDSIQNSFSKERQKKIPCLGLSWSNCVNLRVMITRTDYALQPRDDDDDEEDGVETEQNQGQNGGEKPKTKSKPFSSSIVVRKMEVLLSSHLPHNSLFFIVERSGIRGLPDFLSQKEIFL
eukprot:TRINITY_DN5230_c0_g1_i3.p1 TRINITY_DN5230_c0_g1~~TRINITY_DN5230_c0_g1_i3.p1  ORF type:complete len:262 (+),score=83.24 TRINITY_DN5230_c0_g1_i3:485-1270(+)